MFYPSCQNHQPWDSTDSTMVFPSPEFPDFASQDEMGCRFPAASNDGSTHLGFAQAMLQDHGRVGKTWIWLP
jgi:hypothetical protein